ncbi:uncharacterized protein CIMG_08902 [Coccidioides immitis RS]|uniref:Uncharacterized protein n=1 Tax=Coccidioides immitis (strain RS) TaxID=246410 RepID=J3K6G1_COCIM|nr:uncharacterized protein CIMG_08902 [Coccidioides immitis RS]EAS30156.3 hypothetical protein CIMG_08902 [Coccidioides immitis RS]
MTSFLDASKLVERMKTANGTGTDEELLDFENSLLLGPPVIQGQYDQNFRRFGDAYEVGDQTAREGLKDIVINLQLTLLATLRMALLDNTHPDLAAMLAASDNARLDALMCLYRLGERMALGPPQLNPSSSLPTKPSSSTVGSQSMQRIPSPPLNIRRPMVGPGFETTPRDPHRLSTSQSVSSYDTRNHHLPPISPASEMSLVTPISPFSLVAKDHTQFRDARTPSLDSSVGGSFTGTRYQHSTINHPSRLPELDPSIPPIHEAGAQSNSIYSDSVYSEKSSRPLIASRPSNGGDISSVLGPIRHGPYGRGGSSQENVLAEQNAPSPRSGSLLSGLHGRGKRISASSDEKDTPGPGSRSIFSFTRRAHPVQTGPAQTAPGGPPVTAVGTENLLQAGLYLPSEDNKFAGFCKGAWRLQNGIKKSFRVDLRPSGMYKQISTWRCTKCHFEGPMGQTPTISRNSPSAPIRGFARTSPLVGNSSQDFDQRVRLHGPSGIRYRWSFLAKSHSPIKSSPKANDGTGGRFGCIYCCVEQQGPAPVFADIDTFMQHLRLHAGSAGLADARATREPPQALLDWTKCIVGRVATEEEGFDINIPKVVVEMGD